MHLYQQIVLLLIIFVRSESSATPSSTTPPIVATAHTTSATAHTTYTTTASSTKEEIAMESTGTTHSTTTSSTTSTTNTGAKTIFLVRHAESDENRRLNSLKTAFKDLTRFALPKSKDIMASCELIRIDLQINSNVSQFGKQQIAFMAQLLNETNFVTQQNVQLLVHSPLLRAKETCRDMFGCVLSNTSDESSPLLPPPPLPSSSSSSSSNHNISQVIELDLLTEMTPMEWIPGNAGSLQHRMRAFETWLSQRPETTIVCVGHSQYFKALLQLPYKFHNCDVIRVQFDPSSLSSSNDEANNTTSSPWSNIQDEHLCRIAKPSDDTCIDTNTATTGSSSGIDSTATK